LQPLRSCEAYEDFEHAGWERLGGQIQRRMVITDASIRSAFDSRRRGFSRHKDWRRSGRRSKMELNDTPRDKNLPCQWRLTCSPYRGRRFPSAFAASSEMSIHLDDRAAAAGTGAGRAAEAMIAGHDLAILQRIGLDIPKKQTPVVARPLHAELLIKIAIVHFAAPSDADRVATHESVNGCRVKRVGQQLHIFVQFVVAAKITGKPADGQVRQRVEFVEHNPEMFLQLALVFGLEFGL